MAQLKLWKFFSVLMVLMLIASLGVVVVPASPVEANDNQTLNVAKWTGPTAAGVSGRETVLYDGEKYHMWYSPSDSAIYHTSSNAPTGFTTGTQCTFGTGDVDKPAEVGSVTVLEEGGIFYMIAYEKNDTTDATKKFAIYTSENGDTWAYGNLVFDGTGASITNLLKIDGPYLIKIGDKYRLYFQLGTGATYDSRTYDIYVAESTSITGSYILRTDPVLTHTCPK